MFNVSEERKETIDEYMNEIKEYEEIFKEIINHKKSQKSTNEIDKEIIDTTTKVKELKKKIQNTSTSDELNEIGELFKTIKEEIKKLQEKLQKGYPDFLPKLKTIKDIPIQKLRDKNEKIKREYNNYNAAKEAIGEINDGVDIAYMKQEDNTWLSNLLPNDNSVFKFKYNKGDYIIFKEKSNNDYFIGKIEFIYGQIKKDSNGQKYNYRVDNEKYISVCVKYIEPMNIFLNEGFLHWGSSSFKKTIDLFVNVYELITLNYDKDDNNNNYIIFPLQLFCNINDDDDNIKTKLDEIFNIPDDTISKINYNDIETQENVNIKKYFKHSVPFYGIVDDLIDEHFNRYIEISENFFENKDFYEDEKKEIIDFLNNKKTVDDTSIINGKLGFKDTYLDLVKEMPIKLIPNVITIQNEKTTQNENTVKNERLQKLLSNNV